MRRYNLEVGGTQYVIDVDEITADRYRVLVSDQEYEVRLTGDEDLAEGQITPEIATKPPMLEPMSSEYANACHGSVGEVSSSEGTHTAA